jgi:hypothetical protein
MEIVQSAPAEANEAVGRERTKTELFFYHIRQWLARQRRKMPYLVWYNDELDVAVTFSRERLLPDGTIDDAYGALFGSRLAEVEGVMREMDIEFDRGVGFDGRDWEWDWSLKGPISVRFRHRATKPERRRERLKPKLVCSR